MRGSSYFRSDPREPVSRQLAEVATSATLSADTSAEVATSAGGLGPRPPVTSGSSYFRERVCGQVRGSSYFRDPVCGQVRGSSYFRQGASALVRPQLAEVATSGQGLLTPSARTQRK